MWNITGESDTFGKQEGMLFGNSAVPFSVSRNVSFSVYSNAQLANPYSINNFVNLAKILNSASVPEDVELESGARFKMVRKSWVKEYLIRNAGF